MHIFVAGPYSNDDPVVVESNVRVAMRFAGEIMSRGHVPVVPHLSHWLDLYFRQELGVDVDYETWMWYTISLLDRCEALFFVGPSPGALREANYAKDSRKFIYYQVDDIPTVPMVMPKPGPISVEVAFR